MTLSGEQHRTSSFEYLEKVREQLRYWPYTLHQIDDTLDVSLIEGRGRQLLYRAIHSQNLTAFVGSGLSMSYGRLSWRAWEKEQQRVVERNAKQFCLLAEKALNWNEDLRALVDNDLLKDVKNKSIEIQPRHNVSQWLNTKHKAIEHARQQIERLANTFKLTRDSGGHFPGGEELPVKFEIAQQLHNQLNEFTGLFLPELPAQLNKEERMNAAWTSAYAKERTSAPVRAINKLRECYSASEKSLLKNELFTRSINSQEEFSLAFNEFDDALTRPESHLSFEGLAKSLLIDECPHALILLRQGILKGLDLDDEKDRKKIEEKNTEHLEKWKTLAKELNIFDSSNQKRDIGGMRDMPERFRVLTPFHFKKFEQLRQLAIKNKQKSPLWNEFWAEVNARLNKYLEEVEKAGDSRTYLTPSSRFLVALSLSQCEDPFASLELSASGEIENSRFFSSPESESFTSRRSIMTDRFDPLNKVERDLGITNFITTNYDFELERYFIDQGYRRFEPPAHEGLESMSQDPANDSNNFRSDNIGRVLKDQTFTPEHGAELTCFGLSNRSSGASVFHLHGRATKKDKLVITENDYMRLYLTQDKNRDTVDESISIAFSGAPLLFLGLGMEETDLLRPLRQFISNRDRTIGYTSIALLPAEKSMAARAKFSASLFLRYGVHTIFYGSGTVKCSDKKEWGLDWLHRMVSLQGSMNAVVDKFIAATQDKKIPMEREAITKRLYEDVGEIGPDLAMSEIGYPQNTPALNVLFGVNDTQPIADLFERLSSGNSEDSIELLCCRFTPSRPRRRDSGIHHRETNATIDGEKYLGFYAAIATQLLRITLDLPTYLAGGKVDSYKRNTHLMSLKIAIDGLYGALLTGSLNAALAGIALGKHQWWRDWQRHPPLRLAQAQRLEPSVISRNIPFTSITAGPDHPIKSGTSFVRHRVDNVITLLEDSSDGQINFDTSQYESILEKADLQTKTPVRLEERFRTRVRAFDTFIAAVACEMHSRPVEMAVKRQTITVAARRGLGKGTFMSAFSSSLGQITYKRAAWPQQEVFMAGSIFLNLGFSPEIGSAYDMLRDALINVIALLKDMCRKKRSNVLDKSVWNESDKSLETQRSESFSCQKEERDRIERELRNVSRLTSLNMLFSSLSEASKVAREAREGRNEKSCLFPRMLVTIASADLLFDDAKRPKNGEIDRFFELLFAPEHRDSPVDLVFLADDTQLGEPWSSDNSERDDRPLKCRLDRAFLPELAEERIVETIRTGQIKIDEPDELCSERRKATNRSLSSTLLSPDRVGKSPQDASAVIKKWQRQARQERHYIHYTRPMNAVSLLVDNFPVLATALYLLNPPRLAGDSEKSRDEVTTDRKLSPCWDKLRKAMQSGRTNSDNEMDKIFADPDTIPDKHNLAVARNKVAEEVRNNLRKLIIEHALSVKLQDSEKKCYRTALRERLRSGAYTEGVNQWRRVRISLGNNRFSLTILLSAAETMLIHSPDAQSGAKEAEKFILDIVSQVHNVGQERRDQMVLEAVLAQYRRLHVIGDPDLDCEFHSLILRHLGVIGSPVGGAVLVRLAEFRDYFDRIGVELKFSRRRFLVRALTVLAYRGLVFRLEPHPRLVYLQQDSPENFWNAKKEYRYALHRVVQTFSLRNLEAGNPDPTRTNNFAPSLYAVMPTSGPQLSRTSLRFLRSLLIGLSQYPDISTHDKTAEPWLFTTRDVSVRVQALRAAMTLARSTYSIAVVSRMAAHPPIGEGIQKRGYLETYRVRLRWLIRMAWEISRDNEEAVKANGQDNKNEIIRPLYRDEIVWLYNELGVITLAQGSLSDSLGYLRQAAEANESIEGRSRDAPIYNHIALNHAIVQMERGNFKSARSKLERICGATSSRKWKIYWAAEGYRCVLDHLVGRREGLSRRFTRVTHHFQQRNDSRAASIFLMHQGRFIAEENSDEAARLLKRARDLSETDGHEDIRHHVELAQIRMRMNFDSLIQPSASEIKTIEEVENFGKRTSIWSLQADALWLHASLLLRQGESSTAGQLLIRSMAISKRNSMTLRLNNAMTSYARVLLLRGDVAGATNMAKQSLEQAKLTGYSLETARAQAVLTLCQEMPGHTESANN